MKRTILVLAMLCVLADSAAKAQAQSWVVVDISWDQPVSPTTGNTLIPTNFSFYAAIAQYSGLLQQVEYWPWNIYTSTDYGRYLDVWDLSFPFEPSNSYQLITLCQPFLSIDPLTAEMWHVSSQPTANTNWGPSFVGGNLSWNYWPVQ